MNRSEIVEELQKDESKISKIYIEPPDLNTLSDEDSTIKDQGGTLNNLSSRQLSANDEVVFTSDQCFGGDTDSDM